MPRRIGGRPCRWRDPTRPAFTKPPEPEDVTLAVDAPSLISVTLSAAATNSPAAPKAEVVAATAGMTSWPSENPNQALLASKALAARDTGGRPSTSEMNAPASTSRWMSTPVSMPRPSSMNITSSVATFPVAPLA